MTNIFKDQDNGIQTDLTSFVGEGKKFANPDELAKAYAHAQTFIDQLKDENGQFREGLQNDVRSQEQRALQQPVTPPSPVQDPNPQLQRASQEDLVDRIREVTRLDREQEKQRTNVEQVTNKLTETFGTEQAANEAVKARAQELGVSMKFLLDAAAASPAAFYAQMNLDVKPRQMQAPSGQINTQALSQNSAGVAKPGTYAFYEDLRKSNAKLYNTPKVQLEMHKHAMENPNFFGA